MVLALPSPSTTNPKRVKFHPRVVEPSATWGRRQRDPNKSGCVDMESEMEDWLSVSEVSAVVARQKAIYCAAEAEELYGLAPGTLAAKTSMTSPTEPLPVVSSPTFCREGRMLCYEDPDRRWDTFTRTRIDSWMSGLFVEADVLTYDPLTLSADEPRLESTPPSATPALSPDPMPRLG